MKSLKTIIAFLTLAFLTACGSEQKGEVKMSKGKLGYRIFPG